MFLRCRFHRDDGVGRFYAVDFTMTYGAGRLYAVDFTATMVLVISTL
ncbi:hypothetical protein [Prevotella micans]|nr:hypothetical protein [Prevotella micans]